MDIGAQSVIIAFGVVFGLLIIGVYIGPALGIGGIVGFIVFTGEVNISPLHMAYQQFISVTTTYSYMVVPLFMLLGYFASESGIAEDLFNTADAWFGHLRGGLAITTIVACAGLAAVTGSSLGAAVSMTKIALPEMRKHNCDDRLSLGTITVGGTLALMIPPSITLVLYGIFGEQPIGKLLIAGVVPGLMLAILYIIQIIIRCRIQPSLAPPGPSFNWSHRIKSLTSVLPFIGIIFAVMAGILIGIWTPVEAAGVACIFIFVLAAIRRKMPFKVFLRATTEAALASASIFILIIGAMIFGRFLALTGMGDRFVNTIIAWHLAPFQLFIFLVFVYLILGMFIETSAIIAITIPLVVPLVIATGWNPIWFGVIFVCLIEIALVTPPIGLTVFAVKAALPDVTLSALFMSCIPFWLCNVLALFILYYMPGIALWLPNMMLK